MDKKDVRCRGCFVTHFPLHKFCNKFNLGENIQKKPKIKKDPPVLDEETMYLLPFYISYLERRALLSRCTCRNREEINNEESKKETFTLCGGYGNEPLMVRRAIASAKKHGISLEVGKINAADGNCSFDAVLHNINERSCFLEKLPLSSTTYRQIWVTELENQSAKYPTLGAGFTEEERQENWNLLKQSGVYEVEFFGDLVMHAIAKGCNKNILIFNTDARAADPIYVIRPEKFGGYADSENPVVVCYNQVHYESLHPVTQDDIERTKILVNEYIAGNYPHSKEDIPFLISSKDEMNELEATKVSTSRQREVTSNPISKERQVNKEVRRNEDNRSNNETKENNEWLFTLEQILKIPVKDRTAAHKKRYKNLKYFRYLFKSK